jgi:formyltetrahydrofolate deformylase
MTTYRLIAQCPDTLNIVATVAAAISAHKGSIIEANQHSDHVNKRFFMRYEISGIDHQAFERDFAGIAQQFSMEWQFVDATIRKKVILMATKESHCLADLLHRYHEDELYCDIKAVISNHEDLRTLCDWYKIPYYHVPTSSNTKTESFQAIEKIWNEQQAEVIVLARYMQILPQTLCDRYAGKVINIHHSFLPSFIGAHPYQQAHTRGVKLIGATCHYVTQDLDEGPIIEQDVIRVTHKETAKDLVRLGRDVEKNVLARGLRYHLEDRVLLDQHKTVVFL